MKRSLKSVYSMSALCLVLAGGAKGSSLSLGQAANYQLFVLNNDTQTGSDVQGRVAIGGNYTGSTHFTSGMSDAAGVYDLVVGGALNLSNTTIDGGDVFAGTTGNFTSVTFAHNVVSDGSLSLANLQVGGTAHYATTYSATNVTVSGGASQVAAITPPIDFTAAATNLRTVSTQLSALAATGTTAIDQYNFGITLTTTKTGINVFTVTAAQLAATNNGLTISNGFGSGVTVIVNVLADGSHSDTFKNQGYTLNGIDNQHVLYNFSSNTTQVTSQGGLQGAVLAPWADLNNAGSGLYGQVLVQSLSGNGEIERTLFAGSLPDAPITATPEPSTMMLLSGCGLVFGVIRKYRKA